MKLLNKKRTTSKMAKLVFLWLACFLSITHADFGVPTYKINLDDPPAKRWVQVCTDYEPEL